MFQPSTVAAKMAMLYAAMTYVESCHLLSIETAKQTHEQRNTRMTTDLNNLTTSHTAFPDFHRLVTAGASCGYSPTIRTSGRNSPARMERIILANEFDLAMIARRVAVRAHRI